MKDSTKKVIIWLSVAVVLVGGSVGGYLWYQSRPDKDGEEDSDTDNKDSDNTGGGTGSTGGGSTSGGSTGDSGTGTSGGGTGSTAGTGRPTGTSPVAPLSNYETVKKSYGELATEKTEGNKAKIIVTKTGDSIDKKLALGLTEVTIIYKKIGGFEVYIEGVNDDRPVLTGTYSNGGKELYVTDSCCKWINNKFTKYKGVSQVSAIAKVMTPE